MGLKKGVICALATAQLCVLSVMIALLPGAVALASGSLAVTGTVTNSSGAGVANVTVNADAPGTTTVDFGPVTTASDGTYTLYVDAGSYDFHFDPPSGSGLNSMDDSYVTISGNQTLNMQLNTTVSGYHTISGTITDQNGNMVSTYSPNSYGNSDTWWVYIWYSGGGSSYQTKFNESTGQFSLSAPANAYDMFQINIPGYILRNQSSVTFDLTNSDLIQNFHITFAGVTTTVKDSSGNLLSGVSVTAKSSNATSTPPFVDGSYVNGALNVEGPAYSGTTDSNGNYTFVAPAGVIFPGNQGGSLCGGVYGIYATVSGNQVWMSSDLTLSQPVTVILQQAPTPAAPTNLSAPAAANTPTLTWTASSGAVGYKIYRNGTNVGVACTGTTFTDTSASQGTYTYYVTALNSGGESAASNTISVVVDKTAPTVSSVVLNPTRIKTSGTMTITANASDALSGVAGGEFYIDTDPGVGHGTPMTYASGHISAQTTISGLTRGTHYVYVRAKDNAGNWSSATYATFSFTP
jgi:hypothetical protein